MSDSARFLANGVTIQVRHKSTGRPVGIEVRAAGAKGRAELRHFKESNYLTPFRLHGSSSRNTTTNLGVFMSSRPGEKNERMHRLET